MGFAHAAGDELGDLRAEVEDEDFLVLHGGRVRRQGTEKTKARTPLYAGSGLWMPMDQSAR